MMAKKKGTKAGEKEASFEDSFESLKKVLAEMESGKLSLSESMAKYEEGVGLLRACHDRLGEAKSKIQMLLKVDDQGNPVTESFEHKASVEEVVESDELDESDPNWDGGLF